MCSNILECFLFANDTNLFDSNNDRPIVKLFSAIEGERLFKTNKLSLNIRKTNYIILFINRKVTLLDSF